MIEPSWTSVRGRGNYGMKLAVLGFHGPERKVDAGKCKTNRIFNDKVEPFSLVLITSHKLQVLEMNRVRSFNIEMIF